MIHYPRLLKFMLERHNIYLRRQAGHAFPWTRDPILQRYRFCNIYRELDTVTMWIDERVRKAFALDPRLWLMLCMARHFNLPSTIAHLLAHGEVWRDKRYDPHAAARVAQKIQGQVYTGAYMVNPPTRAELEALPLEYQTKAAWSCIVVLGDLWKDREAITDMLEDATTLWQLHQALLDHRGWAGFMAYEVVSDLRWTRYGRHAHDKLSWAHLGPGALRGLNRLAQRPLSEQLPQDLALREAQDILMRLQHDWPRAHHWPALEMREVEHSLCEWDKYERVRLGEGRPRQLFKRTDA